MEKDEIQSYNDFVLTLSRELSVNKGVSIKTYFIL